MYPILLTWPVNCVITDSIETFTITHTKLHVPQSWKNVFRLFHILAQLPFTTSESELDYHPKKVNIRVTSQLAERPMILKN